MIRLVTDKLGIADINGDEWSSYLVWSNLYKLSPHDGGNPCAFLCNIQQPACIEMLTLELNMWKPQRLLFLTGADWFNPFRTALGSAKPGEVKFNYICECGNATLPSGQRYRYVVAPHPQGKRAQPILADIVSAFSA